MTERSISMGQLVCLLTISSLTAFFTMNCEFLGGTALLDNLLSCLLAVVLSFVLLLPVCIMQYRQYPNLLLQAEAVGKWFLYGIAGFYILFFLWNSVQYLASFQFFLNNAFQPSVPGWLFAVILLLAALYAAYQGLEALGRTAVLLLVLILLGIVLISLLLLTDLDARNFSPLLFYGPNQFLQGTVYFLGNNMGIVLYAFLYPTMAKRRFPALLLWLPVLYSISSIILFSIASVLGNFAGLQLFPFYSVATMANLGSFQRMDTIFIGIWIVGIFLKLALDCYLLSVCIGAIAGKKAANFAKLPAVVCIGALAIVTAGSRAVLNVLLQPMLLLGILLAAGTLLPLTVLCLHAWKQRRIHHAP